MANPQYYIVEYEDGTIGEIPINEAVAPERSAYQFRAGESPSATIAKYASNILQGATLGYGDELAGLAATGLGKLGFNYPSDYQTNVDFYRNILEGTQEDAPITSIATQIAGGLPAGAVAGTNLAKNALLGAIYGAGEANDNRAGGAVIGGILGTAGAKAGELLGSLYETGAKMLPAGVEDVVANAQRGGLKFGKGDMLTPTEKYVTQDIAQRGVTPEVLLNAQTNQLQAIAEGQGVQTLAEALQNPSVSNFAQGIAQQPASAEIATKILKERSGAIPQRLDDILGLISPVNTPIDAGAMAKSGANELDRIASRRLGEASEQVYNTLNWEGVPSERIQEILQTPLAGRVANQVFETQVGGVPEQYTLRDVKRLASGLGKIGEAKANMQISPSEILTPRNAERLGGQLDEALRNQVAGLAEADALYPQMKTEAYGGIEDLGRKLVERIGRANEEKIATQPGEFILKSDPSIVKQIVEGSQAIGATNVPEALKAGVRGNLQEQISKKEGMSAIRDILKKGDKQRNIIESLTGEDVADLIERKVGREISFKQFENATLSQSATSKFTQEEKRLGENIKKILEMVKNPKKTFDTAVDSMLNNWVSDEVKRDITKILYAQGEDAVTKMKRLQPYLKELEKIRAKAQTIATTGRITGSQAGAMFGGKLTKKDI